MPATRSSSRLASAQPTSSTFANEGELSGSLKRKSSLAGTNTKKKAKNLTEATKVVPSPATIPINDCVTPGDRTGDEDTPVPAALTFDFETAKRHLISVDARFEDLFYRMPCRPYEQLEQVHPFRALTISILGQQISWKAARSITHKFIRLYNTSIPEEATDESREAAMEVFPSPHQVVTTDASLLRTAGLSARKAEYIQDLASRFSDGRLSTEKLQNATDDELAEMLIQVKGIGRWTVDMFAIFSLRRPNILPVGDLGVQRGMVRWFLSQHSAVHPYGLSPEKVGGASGKSKGKKRAKTVIPSMVDDGDALPGGAVKISTERDPCMTDDIAADIQSAAGETSLLPPFTPSIHKTPEKVQVALPTGLTVSVLKGRLDGKKVRGSFLTPQEMSDLSESWKPYRSLGVYYMWSLAAPADE